VLLVCVAAALKKAKALKGAACPACPSAAPTAAPTAASALPMQDLILQLFNYTENDDYDDAARMFAPGMAYLTNGQRYDIDLSQPDAVQSVPQRYRSNLVFNQMSDHEMWVFDFVEYPGSPDQNPEMIIVHFDNSGLIDLFSHVESSTPQCETETQKVYTLELQKPDGELVPAPQSLLQKMIENETLTSSEEDMIENVSYTG